MENQWLEQTLNAASQTDPVNVVICRVRERVTEVFSEAGLFETTERSGDIRLLVGVDEDRTSL